MTSSLSSSSCDLPAEPERHVGDDPPAAPVPVAAASSREWLMPGPLVGTILSLVAILVAIAVGLLMVQLNSNAQLKTGLLSRMDRQDARMDRQDKRFEILRVELSTRLDQITQFLMQSLP